MSIFNKSWGESCKVSKLWGIKRFTAITALLALLAGMLGGFIAPSPVLAATMTVSNLNDSGAGSLRQAIIDANSSPGADVIEFKGGLNGTIALSSQLPAITEDLTIRGPGCLPSAAKASTGYSGSTAAR